MDRMKLIRRGNCGKVIYWVNFARIIDWWYRFAQAVFAFSLAITGGDSYLL